MRALISTSSQWSVKLKDWRYAELNASIRICEESSYEVGPVTSCKQGEITPLLGVK